MAGRLSPSKRGRDAALDPAEVRNTAKKTKPRSPPKKRNTEKKTKPRTLPPERNTAKKTKPRSQPKKRNTERKSGSKNSPAYRIVTASIAILPFLRQPTSPENSVPGNVTKLTATTKTPPATPPFLNSSPPPTPFPKHSQTPKPKQPNPIPKK